MVFSIIFILIILICIIWFDILKLDFFRTYEKITGGFFLFVILLSFLSLIIPHNIIISGEMVCIMVLMVTLMIAILNLKYYVFKIIGSLFKIEIAALIAICLLYFLVGASEIRHHHSPDIYGFAAAVGFFTDNFSLNSLRHIYMNNTGLTEAVFYGQSSPVYDAVWQISDMQLRYVCDMVLTVGRIGLPLVGALFGSILNQISSFANFLIVIGIFGIWSFSLLSLRTIQMVYKLFNGNQYLFLSMLNRKVIYFVSIIVLSLSPWATIYVLEGTQTQLWFLVACLWQINLLISSKTDNKIILLNSIKKTILFSLAPIFISFVYPNGIILFIALMGPLWLLLFFDKNENEIKKRQILPMIIGTMLMIPITILLIKGSFLIITNNFLKNTGGSPYYLAVVTLIDLLPVIGYRLKFTDATIPYQGFLPLNNGVWIPLGVLIINLIIILIFIAMIYKKKTNLFRAVLISAVPIMLLIFPMGMLIRKCINHGNFHSYNYSRHLVNYIVLGFPIVIGIIVTLLKPEMLFKRISSKLYIGFILIGGITVFNFINMTMDFNKITERFSIIENVNDFIAIKPQSSIVVTKKPDWRVISLTTIGKLHYLTDTWHWILPALIPNINEGKIRKVYFVDTDVYPAKFIQIGEIEVDHKIIGQFNYDSIRKHPKFHSLSNDQESKAKK